MATTSNHAQPDGLDFDTLLDEASLPEITVSLCLNGKLRREYEEVKDRIDTRAAQDDAKRTAAAAAALQDRRLSGEPDQAAADRERDPEQDQLDELARKMKRYTATFVVRALPSTAYNRLIEKHPPRRDPATGRIDQRDIQNMCNSTTFFPELVRACLAEPEMTEERWKKLNDVITDAQFDRLAQAAATVNRRDEDVPFSLNDSEPAPS